MKKYTRLLPIFIVCIILLIGGSSCSKDDYYLDKYRVDFATVNELSGDEYDFRLDDGTTLWISASATSYKPVNKRVVINYTILSDDFERYDHAIRLNGYVADVLTKEAIYIAPDDKMKQDSIGNDPIKVISIWEGGGYLNIYFKYNGGGEAPHLVNLVSAYPDLSIHDDLVKLEFRHNQNSDPEFRPVYGYVSFDLAPYRTDLRDKVTFDVSVKEGQNETKIYRIEYKYEK